MTAVRVLLLGAGRFGALHARVWSEAGIQLAGVCDLDAGRAESVARRYGALAGDDAASLLERLRPDAVVVATDESSHASLTLQALAAGAHVFVEKPLATSGEEAWAIRSAARRARRQVVVGHILRFSPAHDRMRAAVRDGRIGPLCAIRLRRDFSRAWLDAFGERVHPVWESCVHDVDFAIALTGRPPDEVAAVAAALPDRPVPSALSAHLRFAGEVIATVESAWLIPPQAPDTLRGALELEGMILAEAEVLGREGLVRYRSPSDELVEWGPDGAVLPDLGLWPELGGRIAGALRAEVEYACAVFADRRPPDIMPLDEACWGVETTEAIERSLLRGRVAATVEEH